VLECLSGYLMLGQRLLEGDRAFAEAWNFGPEREGNRTVEQVLAELRKGWPGAEWKHVQGEQPHEATLLHLDSSKARSLLGWRPVWSFEEGVAATAEWYRAWLEAKRIESAAQLERYAQAAAARGLAWAAR
jgi:CDP-glucose 4,6-dehydratase